MDMKKARVNNLLVLAGYAIERHLADERTDKKFPDDEFLALIRSLIRTCYEILEQ